MFYRTLPETQLLPSVSCFAECQLSRTQQKHHLMSVNNKTLGKSTANTLYAKCHIPGTRQNHNMPSDGHVALGKQPVTGNSRWGRLFLPSAKGGALGKWLFPVPRGRARCITAPLPSASNGHSAKTPICRVPTAQH